jgi:hypothetical protein
VGVEFHQRQVLQAMRDAAEVLSAGMTVSRLWRNRSRAKFTPGRYAMNVLSLAIQYRTLDRSYWS